jgi:hypothetical protein
MRLNTAQIPAQGIKDDRKSGQVQLGIPRRSSDRITRCTVFPSADITCQS